MSDKPVIYSVPTGIVDLNSVSQTLIDMMREVKQNPASIPQAASMCDIAGRICEMAKVQVSQGQMVLDLIRTKNDTE